MDRGVASCISADQARGRSTWCSVITSQKQRPQKLGHAPRNMRVGGSAGQRLQIRYSQVRGESAIDHRGAPVVIATVNEHRTCNTAAPEQPGGNILLAALP